MFLFVVTVLCYCYVFVMVVLVLCECSLFVFIVINMRYCSVFVLCGFGSLFLVAGTVLWSCSLFFVLVS